MLRSNAKITVKSVFRAPSLVYQENQGFQRKLKNTKVPITPLKYFVVNSLRFPEEPFRTSHSKYSKKISEKFFQDLGVAFLIGVHFMQGRAAIARL